MSLVLGDGRIDQLDPMGPKAREGSDLIDLHEAAIPRHVGGKHCGEPVFHVGSLPSDYYAQALAESK